MVRNHVWVAVTYVQVVIKNDLVCSIALLTMALNCDMTPCLGN